MDDFLKIKVLMIYYDHWGKEEIKARKIAGGMRKTISSLTEHFQTDDDTLNDALKRMFHDLFLDRFCGHFSSGCRGMF